MRTTTSTLPAVRLRGLAKAVRDVDLDVATGEVVALLGTAKGAVARLVARRHRVHTARA